MPPKKSKTLALQDAGSPVASAKAGKKSTKQKAPGTASQQTNRTDAGPLIEEITDNVRPVATEEPSDDEPIAEIDLSDFALPELTANKPVPEQVVNAGFSLAELPTCDTEYDIQGQDMQVLNVRLQRYQEMCFCKFSDVTHRDPRIQFSNTAEGFMRLKNMVGEGDVQVQFTPGYIAKIVPISLNEHPEIICKPEAFLAATDAGLRVVPELRPGFIPYRALQGKGVVFLKSVGTALFHVLKEGEACIANTPNVVAFQTFCHIEDRTLEHPDQPGMFGKKAPIFPHMHLTGPGLIMFAPLYPDARIIPISLDEYPHLYIKHEVFMAASDANISIQPERLKRGKEANPKGEIFYCMHGKGVLFLNLTGSIVKLQKLAADDVFIMNTLSVVAFQGSCKVSQEKATQKDSKYVDLKVKGPGLVIIQSLSSAGRAPSRWGLDALLQPRVVPKPKETDQNKHRNSATPLKPVPTAGLGTGYDHASLSE